MILHDYHESLDIHMHLGHRARACFADESESFFSSLVGVSFMSIDWDWLGLDVKE